nr:hypothetical protein [Vibrio crassostreae]
MVYDLFHVVAKFGREVMHRVRVEQVSKLKQDKKRGNGYRGTDYFFFEIKAAFPRRPR